MLKQVQKISQSQQRRENEIMNKTQSKGRQNKQDGASRKQIEETKIQALIQPYQ